MCEILILILDGVACEACSTKLKLCANSAFTLRLKSTVVKLDTFGLTHDLQSADFCSSVWHLDLKTITLVRIGVVAIILEHLFCRICFISDF